MSAEQLKRWAPLVLLVGLAVVAFWKSWPDAALPADAPLTEFSGQRAHAHLQHIASGPHPSGTAENAAVLDYLIATLEGYGLETDVQREIMNNGHSVVYTENLFARIPGRSSANPFMVTAHYDSAKQSFGAADDCAGVVAMLEAARVLAAEERMQHDIVFVFTSGEERGGTARVVLQHPWVQNLSALLGLEGRGTYGPAFMFETNPGNGNIIPELIASGAPAHATSLMFAVHDRTPNGTDFGTFKRQGAVGYNVAFVGGLGWYHTWNDRPEHVSAASLQQMGGYTLSLARHFGPRDGQMTPAPDRVYFNTIGTHLITYPGDWSRTVTALAVLLAAIALGSALFRRVLSPLRLLLALVLVVVLVAATGAVTGAFTYVLYQSLYVYMLYNAHLYQTGFVLIGLAGVLLAAAWDLPRLATHFYTAGLLIWATTTVVLEFVFPEATFAAAWPVIFAALALFAISLAPRGRLNESTETAILSLGAVPALLLAVPGFLAMHLLGAAFALAPLTILFLLVALLLMPALHAAIHHHARRAAALSLLAGLAVVAYGWATNGFTAAHPQQTSLVYALNQATGKAAWLSTDPKPNSWTAAFLGEEPKVGEVSTVLPDLPRRYFMAEAPLADLAGPQLTVLEDVVQGERRSVRLRYDSPRRVPETSIRLLSPAKIFSAQIDDEPLLADGVPWHLNVDVMPHTHTFELHFEVSTEAPLRVRVEDTSYRLPDVVALGYPAMPDWMVPKANTLDWWEASLGSIGSGETRLVQEFDFGLAPAVAAR